MSVLWPTIRNFAPRPRMRAIDWFRENASTQDGRPYDHSAYPHLGAPGGPCDALDDPAVVTIWLQWGSRLGKTFFGQCASMFYADANPCPMMFASASEQLAVDVIKRTYGMLERCPALRDKLKPELRRKQSQVDFPNCRIYVAWARSVSTLADKAVRLGHGNEIDKWEHLSTSKEADPLKLFSDRGKEFPSRKFIYESTPTVKGRSRVERGRLGSTNCSYHVPCPHCGGYQQIRLNPKDGKGGIVWEKLPNGKSDRELARKSAHYVCCQCGGKILDEHRSQMMRRGVWCPEGCEVDSVEAARIVREGHTWHGWRHAIWIKGEPPSNVRDAGYQLSSLYALSLGWGDIAAEFVESSEKKQNLRNFVNQWLAETWEDIKAKATWQQLGEKLIDRELPRERIPDWATLITVGADRQQDRYVFVVDAWGPGRSHATILYGELEKLSQLYEQVLKRSFSYVGGGQLNSCFALVDSGYRPENIYEFCRDCTRSGMQVWPCKGSSTSLEADFRVGVLGKDTSMPGMKLVRVDTIRTQVWMQNVLHGLDRDHDGAMSLFSGTLYDHQDFLEQLLNDGAYQDEDTSNNERERWQRLDVGIPNDYRDCKRYSYTAMLIATRGRPIMPREGHKRPTERERPPDKVKFLERPGGWLNVR